MNAINCRRFAHRNALSTAVAAAAGLLSSVPAEAMPFDARLADSLNGMIEKAQVVFVNPGRLPPRHNRHRNHRRWCCGWNRGRGVRGWR